MTRETTRKLLSTIAALAATGALVFGMQLVAQKLVSSPDGKCVVATPEPGIVAAPRVYDLFGDIPEDLDLNLGGMSVARRTERMDMPIAMAEKVLENRAVAAGWTRAELPLVSYFSTVQPGEQLWRRPDGVYISRKLTPLQDQGVQLDEYEFPFAALPAFRAEGDGDPMLALSGASGRMIRLRLPKYLSAVIVGEIISTHRIVRGQGTAFYVTAVSRESVESLRRRFSARAGAEGWVFAADQPDRAEKENLCVQATFNDFGAQGTVVAVYRFADDENYITKGTQQ